VAGLDGGDRARVRRRVRVEGQPRKVRRLQIAYVYEQHLQGRAGSEEIADFEAQLRPAERAAALAARGGGGFLPVRLRRLANHLVIRALGQFPSWHPPRDEGRFRSILDVHDAHM